LAGHAVRKDWKASGGLSARLQGAEPRSPRGLCTCGAEPGIPQVLLGTSSLPMADLHRRLFFHVLVRRLGESDFSFLTTVSEDAELTMFTMGTYRGREGWRQALTTWRETLDVSLEVSEFINLGADSRVLVEIRTTGRASGLDVEDVNYLVVQVDDGQSTWGQFYRDRDDALKAAGLSE
jgi:hypothetical protein